MNFLPNSPKRLHQTPPQNPRASSRRTVKGRSLVAALTVLTGLACVPQADAIVTFKFVYKDAAGTGFNDPARPEYKAGLEAAALVTGSFFANTATIVLSVTSTNDPMSSSLAAAGSSFSFPSDGQGGFLPYVTQAKIISNNPAVSPDTDPDGTVSVNFGKSFQFDANSLPAANQTDYRATMIHELTHALGFAALLGDAPKAGPQYYSTFDSFLTDASGVPLVNPQTFTFDQSKLSTLTGGNNTLMDAPSPTGEYFSSPTAIARFDNKRIPIFSPSPYQKGSSGSHMDDNTRATKFFLMAAAYDSVASMGRAEARTYSAAEEGIMTDLGYTLASSHPLFAAGEVALQNKVYYLSFPNGNIFGYYSYLTDPRYIYHQDLGYEYTFEANDGKQGVYLYDFKSQHFFYTSPTFAFPYLYDFTLNAVLYYPDPANAGQYNTNGVRYFYNFATGAIITQ